jgi:3-oxoadipate enol-lactonase
VPFLAHGGAQLYYEVEGAGPALIFAHGLGGNHLSWWQQVPHFRVRYTCVTFAHRGFAPSTEAPGGPGPRAFADDLATLIDHLGLRDVRLVAQSMGGWTCLAYALREPARVRALVMACTVGGLSHPDVDRAFAVASASGAERELAGRGIHPAMGERIAREQPALHHLYQALARMRVGLDTDAVRATLWEMRTVPASALAALTMPVLCLTGEEDVVIPSAAVATLAALVPDGRLVRVPRAGHSVYFERAEAFNRAVDGFLAEVQAGPGATLSQAASSPA